MQLRSHCRASWCAPRGARGRLLGRGSRRVILLQMSVLGPRQGGRSSPLSRHRRVPTVCRVHASSETSPAPRTLVNRSGNLAPACRPSKLRRQRAALLKGRRTPAKPVMDPTAGLAGINPPCSPETVRRQTIARRSVVCRSACDLASLTSGAIQCNLVSRAWICARANAYLSASWRSASRPCAAVTVASSSNKSST